MLICSHCSNDTFNIQILDVKVFEEAKASRIAVSGTLKIAYTETRYFCCSCGKETIPIDIPPQICDICGEIFARHHTCRAKRG